MGKRTAGVLVLACVVAAGFMVRATLAPAQQGPGHSMAVVVHEESHVSSHPLRNIPPIPPQVLSKLSITLRHPHPLGGVRRLLPDAALQTSAGPLVVTTGGPNFLGVGAGLGSFSPQFAPPDTNGAAGSTQFVQWVNVDFAVFDKASGSVIYGPVAGNTLWSQLGGACAANNSGDPIAQYDKQAGRWVMLQAVFKNPYTLCVAVSKTSDATGSYNLYSFPIPGNYFPDYPKLGVWPDGYYVSYNQFSGNSFNGPAACALDRTNMLQGKSATMQCFQRGFSDASLLPSDLDGDSGAAGTTAAPPAGAPNYYLELGSSTSLDLYKFHVDWANSANSTFTGPTAISVPSYSQACGGGSCVPQSGTNELLDSLGDRLMYRLAYRNLGGNETLVATHSVDTGSGNTGVRWYEIQGLNGTPTAVQKSTYAPDSNYRWMSSIGMDKFGDIALGYSVSGSAMHPAVRYTGRLASDAPSTLESEDSIVEGGGSQLTNLNRWGDYSSMAVDPVDDCTFWYTNEYLLSNGTFNWSTQIASFNFASAGCGTAAYSVAASPSIQSAGQGSSANYTLTLSPSNGYSGTVNLSAVGLPSGATASFNNSSIPGTGGSSTLTVSTDSSVPVGTYNFTVQGSDGTLTSLTPLVLVLTPSAAADFSISGAPSSQSVTQGQSANYTVTVSSLNNFNGTVNLSASVSPSGPTASIPPSVSVTPSTAGTATLNVSTTSSTTTGPYTVTITGASGSLSHQTQVSLQVNPASPTGSFTLGAASGSLTVAPGSSATDTLTVTPSGGFTGSVSLSISGLPPRTSAGFSINPVSITGAGSASSVLTVTANRKASTGTYPLTVTATSASLTKQISLTLVVGSSASPDVSLSGSGATVTQGSSGNGSITVTPSGGFTGNVSLSVTSSLPAGMGVSFSPNPVSITGASSVSSTMTVTTTSSTPTGSYALTVTGTGGGLTRTTNVTVTVNSTAAGGFSLSAAPGSVTVQSGGGAANYTITVTPSGGFTGTVNFSVSGLPPQSSASLPPVTISNTSSASSTLTVTTGRHTPPKTYTLTITGTDSGGTLTQSIAVSLTVQ